MKPDYRGSWIAVYERLLDSNDFLRLSLAERGIFLQCLLFAARKERDVQFHGRTYHLQPGQFVTTLSELAGRCGYGGTVKIVRRTIDKLKASKTWADGRADGRADAPRLITWLNWASYQFPYNGGADGRAGLGQTEGIQTQSATSGKNSYTVVTSFDTQTRSLEDMSSSETFQPEKAEQGEKQQKQEQAKKKSAELEKAYEVLSYLNTKADHHYEMRPNSVINILARLRDGATVEDLKLIIDYKVNEWGQKSEFRKNLNNETLFRACHYSTYLEDAKQWKEQNKRNDDPFHIMDDTTMMDAFAVKETDLKPGITREELQKMKSDKLHKAAEDVFAKLGEKHGF